MDSFRIKIQQYRKGRWPLARVAVALSAEAARSLVKTILDILDRAKEGTYLR